MSEERISSYIDLEAVGKETTEFKEQLSQIFRLYKAIEGSKVGLSADKSFKAAAESIKKYKTEEQELIKVELEIEAAKRKRLALDKQANIILAEEKELLRQRSAELKNSIREQNAQTGSIEQLRATLIRLNKEYDNLSQAEREAGQGTSLKNSIKATSDELKKLEGETGRFQRNVGNYSGAVKTLEKALNDVRAKLDEYNKSGKVSQLTIAALTKEEGILANLVSTQANGFASATLELRNNEKALQQLQAAGLQTSAFYKDLLKETAALKDNVGDLKEEIKNLASDTSTLDGLIQGAETLAGVYGIAQGSAALFGDDNEELAKTMVKLQAVMTILNGLQAVRNALQSQSSFMLLVETVRTKALAAAQVLYTFATGGATVATNALRVALLSTGIGAVLVLIGSAASAMNLFGDKTEEAADDLDAFNASLENSKAILDGYTKSLDFNNQIAIEKLKQRGASEKEINDQVIAGIENRKKANADEIVSLTNKYSNLTTKDKDYAEKSFKILDEIDERKKESQDFDRQIQLTREQFRTKEIEDTKKNGKEQVNLQKESAERAKEYAERERRAQFELAKLRQQDKIDRLKELSENEGGSLSARTKARIEQFEVERALALAERDFELQNTKLTTSERLLIEAQANNKIIALEKDTANQIIAIRQSIRNAENAQADADSGIVQAGIEAAEEKRFERAIERIENQAMLEAEANLAKYRAGEIDKEQYEANKLGIENKARRLSLLAEIDLQERLLQLSNLAPDKIQEAEKKLAALRKQLNADDLKNTEDTVNKKIELENRKNEKLKELGSELRELAFTFLTAGIEKEKNEIQGSIDALEKKKQKDIEVANQSIANSAERADAIAVIEARANAQREQFEQRKRKLDQERAKYERAANIASIIQSTAIAVVSALGAKPFTPANIGLAAIVGAIGAVQIARTLATPLPKYFKGRDKNDPYEGPAVVGDGGKSEVHIRKDGSMEITPNKPTLTYVQKGDVILPDASVLLSLAKNSTDRTIGNAHLLNKTVDTSKVITGGMNKMSKEIVKAIKDKTEVHIKTPSMRDVMFKDGPNFREYLNERI